MVRLSRRGFLGAAMLGGAWLAGCGSRGEPVGARRPADEVRTRIAARGAGRGRARRRLPARRGHRPPGRAATPPGSARERAGASGTADLATALARKQEAVFTFVEALPQLPDPDERVALMQVLASEAEQIAALRLADGQEPVPDAFAGFVT